MSDNPYATPTANLQSKSTDKAPVKQFPRFTTWAVVGLSIITMGIYTIYWLYSRTQILNTLLPENKIPSWLTTSSLIVFFLYLVMSFAPLANNGVMPNGMDAFSLVINLAYIVLFITWAFSFRSRLNTLSGSNKGDLFWLGGILTFFINVYYFQYRINQIHDHG
ncbi:MAG: DUF4234 domain-containing protein [Cocleimonas sp.]|nr:DUF4234 domain-containing protein [Cocleimonas sp.]